MKRILLSLAAAAFVFGGTAALQPTPAEATGWTKQSRGAAVAGWSWRDHWAAKMERKRMWWAEKMARKGKSAEVRVVEPAPRARVQRPLK